MRPILFELGPFTVYAWGTTYVVAFLAGLLWIARRAKHKGVNPERMVDMVLYIALAALAGGRLLYVALDWRTYVAQPLRVYFLPEGGLSFFGGLAAGILVGVLYVRRHRLPVGDVADMAAAPLALGYAIVRIGCLLNGCCYGLPTALPWGITLWGAVRHPTQIYALIGSLLLIPILLLLERNRPFAGYVFVMYIGLYSLMRYVVEFYRVSTALVPGLTTTQALCLVLAAGAFGYVVFRVKSRVAKS